MGPFPIGMICVPRNSPLCLQPGVSELLQPNQFLHLVVVREPGRREGGVDGVRRHKRSCGFGFERERTVKESSLTGPSVKGPQRRKAFCQAPSTVAGHVFLFGKVIE